MSLLLKRPKRISINGLVTLLTMELKEDFNQLLVNKIVNKELIPEIIFNESEINKSIFNESILSYVKNHGVLGSTISSDSQDPITITGGLRFLHGNFVDFGNFDEVKNITKGITVCLWVRRNGATGSLARLFGKQEAGLDSAGFSIGINDTVPFCVVGSSNLDYKTLNGTINITDNKIHSILFTYDTNELKLYTDLNEEISITYNSLIGINDNNLKLMLDATIECDIFFGYIYNRRISKSEIIKNYFVVKNFLKSKQLPIA